MPTVRRGTFSVGGSTPRGELAQPIASAAPAIPTAIDMYMVQGPEDVSGHRLRAEYDAACWSRLQTSEPAGTSDPTSFLQVTCDVTNLSVQLFGDDQSQPQLSIVANGTGDCRYSETAHGSETERAITVTVDGSSLRCVEKRAERVSFGAADIRWKSDAETVHYTGWCMNWPTF